MRVEQRVHRILRRLESFKLLQPAVPLAAPEVPREDVTGERFLGVYQNHPGLLEECILVTERSLHVFQREWCVVPYRQIASARIPEGAKEDADCLLLVLQDGSCVHLPVRGGKGRTRDAFEFLRFIIRVLADLRAEEGA